MHVPVLLNEAVNFLDPKAGEFVVDGTIGSAGHGLEILKRVGPRGKLLGVDWDSDAIRRLKTKGLRFKNLILAQGNYADLPEILRKKKLGRADGLILDLGFSSEQLEKSGRGFSFLKNEPLIMRYDAGNGEKERRLTAAEAINSFYEKELAEIFWKYGGERFSRRIAKAIVEERRKKRITTTLELAEIVKRAAPKNYERGRIHPATRVFQALRIYVNHELENLGRVLINLRRILKPGGRVVVISFHSLEDRIVKENFRKMAKERMLEIFTKKPVVPSREEILKNSRSRSAKLRAAALSYKT